MDEITALHSDEMEWSSEVLSRGSEMRTRARSGQADILLEILPSGRVIGASRFHVNCSPVLFRILSEAECNRFNSRDSGSHRERLKLLDCVDGARRLCFCIEEPEDDLFLLLVDLLHASSPDELVVIVETLLQTSPTRVIQLIDKAVFYGCDLLAEDIRLCFSRVLFANTITPTPERALENARRAYELALLFESLNMQMGSADRDLGNQPLTFILRHRVIQAILYTLRRTDVEPHINAQQASLMPSYILTQLATFSGSLTRRAFYLKACLVRAKALAMRQNRKQCFWDADLVAQASENYWDEARLGKSLFLRTTTTPTDTTSAGSSRIIRRIRSAPAKGNQSFIDNAPLISRPRSKSQQTVSEAPTSSLGAPTSTLFFCDTELRRNLLSEGSRCRHHLALAVAPSTSKYGVGTLRAFVQVENGGASDSDKFIFRLALAWSASTRAVLRQCCIRWQLPGESEEFAQEPHLRMELTGVPLSADFRFLTFSATRSMTGLPGTFTKLPHAAAAMYPAVFIVSLLAELTIYE